MKVSATEFKNRLGEYMQLVYQEPIVVQKSGKPSAVFISHTDFQRFSNFEDLYWGMKAEQASKDGHLSPEESMQRLKSYAERAGMKIEE